LVPLAPESGAEHHGALHPLGRSRYADGLARAAPTPGALSTVVAWARRPPSQARRGRGAGARAGSRLRWWGQGPTPVPPGLRSPPVDQSHTGPRKAALREPPGLALRGAR
jgi:hypothetical protein